MKNVMKKIGRTIVAFLPVLACFLLQFVVMFVAEIVLMFPTIMESITGNVSYDELMQSVYGLVMENIMTIQIAALIVLMGPIMQFGISSVLSLIESLAPKAMENYNELMELMGLGEVSLPVMIAISIMAPLSEEVLCRGVIFRLAERVSPKFWVANVIQALAFGILHGNIVQGAYAFLLGLLLGFIYGKYRNIWLCMLLHGAMNLSSYLVSPFYMLFPENMLLPVFIAVLAVSAALFAVCFRPFVTRKQGV